MGIRDRVPRNYFHIAAALGALGIAATLLFWGQPLICTCGYVRLWVNSIFSSENSQQIADWYTLSHVVHGMLIVLLGRLLLPGLGFWGLYAIAIVTGVAWEIIEHTDLVLDQFRAVTIYQGYLGDSVLNAVADYLWMLAGFFVASRLSTSLVFLTIAAFEIGSALIARDSLTLTTLMLIYPFESIETWQQAINPVDIPTADQ